MDEASLGKISEDLATLKKEVHEICLRMVDSDSLLTTEEAKELDKSIENYKKGKTTNIASLKKELGYA